ncbi:hypothetical protein BGZ61DRAFT_451275 [Ilyonectria robusta]|uniref:uncharacterized protein n=1 Tax=Ilyonectria robusta TaxID=1079257 RepID=UPI001E8D5DDF|nr:uncharacterized protein BGZ61DRAFT_451275 [Ilyonectria robusta]KAH8699763.1 hypothetical protein BGZ61DRAFT_451275 [Ilyonectria robusta]
MKFFVPLALLAAVGVSAATTVSTAASASSTACDADYIVTQCLETEEKKPALCDSTDYGCLCAAYQSIATCYNNCPNDPRGASAQNQVTVNCANASIYSTTSKKSTKTAAAASGASETSTTAAAADASATESSATAIQSSSPSATGNAAGDLARNTGGVLLAVAGVVAALL